MKIRNGFVTNSSSTSFIISTKESFSRTSFMNSVGADGESAMNKLFEDLFFAIDSNKQDIKEAVLASGADDVEDFLKNEGYDDNTIKIIKKFLSEGRVVYYGKLSSDGESAAEIYFCCDSFVWCDEDIYFNGSIGGW